MTTETDERDGFAGEYITVPAYWANAPRIVVRPMNRTAKETEEWAGSTSYLSGIAPGASRPAETTPTPRTVTRNWAPRIGLLRKRRTPTSPAAAAWVAGVGEP